MAPIALLYSPSLTTLCAIVNFGFRQPMWDQWREYETFLGLPFPQNVIQLANGHRPILPNLVRVAEIHWFAANQLLQLSVGAACAFEASYAATIDGRSMFQHASHKEVDADQERDAFL